MAIIGLLVSLVAPNVTGNLSKSKQGTAAAQMQVLETALDTYYLDVGDYPSQLSELRTSTREGWNGPYLKKDVPNDPWKNPYQLDVPGPNNTPYLLQSLGKDGQIGGEGENADIKVGS